MSNATKRSIVLNGQLTSVMLEDIFWQALETAAQELDTTKNGLVETIKETANHEVTLSASIRVWLFDYFSPYSKQRFCDDC